MHVNVKNMPKLTLANLLKRRKTTLLQFIKDSGIQAYGALVERCSAMGVQPPSEEEYTSVVPVATATSQQDGIIVVDPLPVIDEMTGRVIDIDAPAVLPGVSILTDAQDHMSGSQKKRRKSKEET